jgi:hypothetical protein
MRRFRALVTVAAILAAMLIPGPAQAEGGGCGPTRSFDGWSATACSSDDGVFMYPDFYINANPRGYYACQVLTAVELNGIHYDHVGGPYGCAVGRHHEWPVYIRGQLPWDEFTNYIIVQVKYRATGPWVNVVDARSPATRCC